MDRISRTILTNMCMVYDMDRILVEEKRGNNYKGIVFPGGHIEAGESITDSVIREIFEETGLVISNPRLCGVKDWMEDDQTRYIVFLFKADQFTGELKSSEEGEVFWIRTDELNHLPWIWHMDRMKDIFISEKYTEMFLDHADNWKPLLK